MSFSKNISFLFFAVGVTAVYAVQEVENYDSGKIKVVNIMSNDETGVAAYNKKNVHCAETLNIAHDLNIEAIAEFFPCKTLIGKTFITETLKFPVGPCAKSSVIANRQRVIKMLIEHPELKKEVDAFLESAKTNEQEVIKLMSEFFMGKSCPELKQLEQLKQQNPLGYRMVKFLTLNKTGRNILFGINMFGGISTGLSAVLNSFATYQRVKNGSSYGMQAYLAVYFSFLSGVFSYGLHQDYKNASDKRCKLYALNQLITAAEKIENLCEQYAIKSQFSIGEITNKTGSQLIKDLKHSRYQQKSSVFFNIPAVHIFMYDVYQEQKYLAEVFACIAEMDAYNAIATKMLESQNPQNKFYKNNFCFVNFIDNTQPVVRMTGLWNVLVENAVPNSIIENRQILLTGPNAGGKTTTIRSILQNIMLGQTFGVAAAETCEFTMFDVIHSYLNVSDDLIKGDSLFVSEVKRAKAILQTIKSLEAGKKFFFALDELFTGTVSEDGETCAYKFVEKIAGCDGAQFIYATHFGRLKELGNTNVCCVNYKVDAPIKNSDGKLIYPYTLSKGASESRVAIDIAKEAKLFD